MVRFRHRPNFNAESRDPKDSIWGLNHSEDRTTLRPEHQVNSFVTRLQTYFGVWIRASNQRHTLNHRGLNTELPFSSSISELILGSEAKLKIRDTHLSTKVQTPSFLFVYELRINEDSWSHRFNGWNQCKDLTYPVVNSGEESHTKILWDTFHLVYGSKLFLILWLSQWLPNPRYSGPLIWGLDLDHCSWFCQFSNFAIFLLSSPTLEFHQCDFNDNSSSTSIHPNSSLSFDQFDSFNPSFGSGSKYSTLLILQLLSEKLKSQPIKIILVDQSIVLVLELLFPAIKQTLYQIKCPTPPSHQWHTFTTSICVLTYSFPGYPLQFQADPCYCINYP